MSFLLFRTSKLFLKSIFIIIPFFLFSCSTSRISTGNAGLTSAPPVRILLNEPSSSLDLLLSDNCRIYSDEGSFVINGRKGEVLNFSYDKKISLRINRGKYAADYFIIKPEKNLTYNKKVLSGDLKVISDGSVIYLLNLNNIETYLKGVIPSEMPLGRGNEYFEALKAFSIIARTFTLQRISSAGKMFDVRTDVRDQVYGGTGRHQEISNRAVDETEGIIITHNNKPATVFYSSTCGGHTEDVANVFGNTKIPYLGSVKDGEPAFCSASPRFIWQEKISDKRIISLLKRGGKINNEDYKIVDININSRFTSGRVNELQIILRGKEGSKHIKLYGNNIRFIVLTGTSQPLNSNFFDISRTSDGYVFKGKGWGHGVGLCQWGALIQSVQGRDYLTILEHYFPRTEIQKHYD